MGGCEEECERTTKNKIQTINDREWERKSLLNLNYNLTQSALKWNTDSVFLNFEWKQIESQMDGACMFLFLLLVGIVYWCSFRFNTVSYT